jgi:DNA-binding NarL/FixJ family response regulator
MTSIAVIEDHPVFRHGLIQLVEQTPDLVLTGGYGSVEDFMAAPETAEVVLLDLNLPGVDGPAGVHAVLDRDCKVLVISAQTSRDAVLDAIAAGALGYLAKDAHPEEIATAIDVVASGRSYVSATLASLLLDAERASRASTTGHALALSEREKEVLSLLAQGERDQDIAEQLFISVRTVRSHLDRIRDKTGRRRRPDLTRLAIEEGLLDPDREHP